MCRENHTMCAPSCVLTGGVSTLHPNLGGVVVVPCGTPEMKGMRQSICVSVSKYHLVQHMKYMRFRGRAVVSLAWGAVGSFLGEECDSLSLSSSSIPLPLFLFPPRLRPKREGNAGGERTSTASGKSYIVICRRVAVENFF